MKTKTRQKYYNELTYYMEKQKHSSFTFRMPNGLRSNLEDIAIDNEVSMSELVRYSLKNLIDNEQK
jgi:hypothetical protein